MPDDSKAFIIEKYQETAEQSLQKSLDYLVKQLPQNLIFCVENASNFHLKYIQKVLPAFLTSGKFFLNWDVGHSFKGELQQEEFILKYKDKVHYLHLHDVKDGRDHLVIGAGEIDFTMLAGKIRRCQNLDKILIEIKTLEGIQQSLENLTKLRVFI